MQEPGGFIQGGLLSPPPSSIASSSVSGSTLPRPRSHPLKLGGAKETAFIHHADSSILNITRRYAIKFGSEDAGKRGAENEQRTTNPQNAEGRSRGYESFREPARDIERLLDVVWVSGTPSLQIPYLLSLALLTVTYIPGFPPAPRSMFRLLDKLDVAFASLVQGKDAETGETLPGCEGRRGVSGTEKVRIKSLIERTRVVVVEVMTEGEYETEEGNGQDRNEEMMDMDAETDFAMEIARIYDRTLVELGDTLGGPSIGIPDG